MHFPRPAASKNTMFLVVAVTLHALLFRDPCIIFPSPSQVFKSFELIYIALQLPHSKLKVLDVYHISPSFTVI
jgi:hypothetical protein